MSIKSVVLLLGITVGSLTNSPAQTTKPMRITENQKAPDFQVQDVYGNPVSLATLKGKKVFLSFFRTAGCPVCNLRFHELSKEADYFKSKGMVELAVYQSQTANMLTYIGNNKLYPTMIADPAGTLYQLYSVERSMGKLMSSLLFHGGFGDVNKGKKLFTRKVEDDGPIDLIGAEFLIDETGKVVKAHYGRYSGDFLPIADIKAFAAQ